jgi:mono/diheme cytochrome c family protein
VDEVSKQVINGGGGMPAYGGDLTDAQVKAVSEFVAENDGSN